MYQLLLIGAGLFILSRVYGGAAAGVAVHKACVGVQKHLTTIEGIYGMPAGVVKCRASTAAGAAMVDIYDSRNGNAMIRTSSVANAAMQAVDAVDKAAGNRLFGVGVPYSGRVFLIL